MSELDNAAGGREFVISRHFDVPRERLFRAWVDAEQLRNWWGPAGFTASVCTVEAAPGGSWRICLHALDGYEVWYRGIYVEVAEPEKIVFRLFFSDAEGAAVPASTHGLGDDWPLETIFSVTFQDEARGSRLTIRQAGVPPSIEDARANEGWEESFQRLDAVLAEK